MAVAVAVDVGVTVGVGVGEGVAVRVTGALITVVAVRAKGGLTLSSRIAVLTITVPSGVPVSTSTWKVIVKGMSTLTVPAHSIWFRAALKIAPPVRLPGT
jgi:hypothetical protein